MENRVVVARGGKKGQVQRAWEDALGSVNSSALAVMDTEPHIALQAECLVMRARLRYHPIC